MENKVKKSGVLFLIVTLSLLLVILVGCAGTATTAAPSTTAAPPKTTVTVAPTTTAPITTAPVTTAPTSAPPSTTAGKQIVLSMAGTVPENDIKTRAMRNFAAEVLDKSNGTVKINVFPNGQLVLDKDMVTAIPAGMADLAQCQLGSFSGLVPEAAIMDLGMVFSNDDHWFAVANGKVGDIITTKLAAKANSKFLCWMAQGPTSVFASTTKTIKTPDDMKGLKFRTPPSAYYVKAVGALGAAGTIISANELYTALQTNTVSATFCTSRTFNENKWFEVAPYVSRMLFAPQSSHSFIANLDSWKKLPADAQQIIMTAAKNQEAWTRANSAADDAGYWKTIQDLKDSGKIKDLYVIPDPVVKQFIAIVMPSQIAAINADPNITPGVMDLVEQARPK